MKQGKKNKNPTSENKLLSKVEDLIVLCELQQILIYDMNKQFSDLIEILTLWENNEISNKDLNSVREKMSRKRILLLDTLKKTAVELTRSS